MDAQFAITVLVAVLSSSFFAAILSSAISIYLKRKDFENDFFREIVNRRIAVYQTIESVIASLKTTGLDNDGRAYHLVFAFGMDQFMSFHQNVALANTQNLWVSDETNAVLSELGQLLYRFGLNDDSDAAIKEIGKQRYIEIGQLRNRLEQTFRKDFVAIHKVKSFLRSKRTKNDYYLMDVRTGDIVERDISRDSAKKRIS